MATPNLPGKSGVNKNTGKASPMETPRFYLKHLTPAAFGNEDRKMILSIWDYFKKKNPASRDRQVCSIVAKATGLREKTIWRITKQFEKESTEGDSSGAKNSASKEKGSNSNSTSEESPMETSSTPTPTPTPTSTSTSEANEEAAPIELDDFMKSQIRLHIHELFRSKELPKIAILTKKINEDALLPPMTQTMLQKSLKKAGYTFVARRKNSRRFLVVEKDKILMTRWRYLAGVREARESGKNIVFIGDTVIDGQAGKDPFESAQTHHRYSNGQWVGRYINTKLIVTHAGNEKGFISGAASVTRTTDKAKTLNGKMTRSTFVEWFSEQLVPNLPEGSVIVLEDKKLHRQQKDRPPTWFSTKAYMQEWLTKNGVPWTEDLFRCELLTLAKKASPNDKTFQVVELAKEKGHTVLWLPEGHTELNPLESILSDVRVYVDFKNTTRKLTEVEKLVPESINEIPIDSWVQSCKRIQVEEKRMNGIDGIIDEEVEQYKAALADDCSSSESDWGSGSETDDDPEEGQPIDFSGPLAMYDDDM